MKRFLVIGALSLAVLVAGPLLLELMRKDPGYILVSYGNKTLETSFWFAVVAVVAMGVCGYLGFRLLVVILRSFGVSLRFFTSHRSRQYSRRTNRGLIHYIEGNWRAAKKDLLSVAKYSDAPLVHYLAAAHSAHQLGDRDESQRLLSLAEQSAPENELAVLLSQAKIQLADKQLEKCLATLERANRVAPEHPVVLDLLRETYVRVNDWNALTELLPKLKASRQYSPEDFQQLEIHTNCQRLLTESRHGDPDTALQRVTSLWQKLPKHLQRSPELVEQYVTILLEAGEHDKAEILLRQALNRDWSKALVSLYGRAQASAPAEQLVVGEQWLREHPGDAELLFALARIAMRNQLWGKARSYFESSLQLQERPEAYAELAALVARLGDHQQSIALYQKGLLLTTQQAKIKREKL